MKKFRKKGQLFIEAVIVLPLMLIFLWLLLQLIVFVYANNQVNHAAEAGSAIVSQQLRGTEDKVNVLPNKAQIINDLHSRLGQSMGNNGFILYSKDSNGNNVTLSNFTQEIENKTNCQSAMKNSSTKRVICVYTESISVGGRSHDEIIVKVKVPFNIIGNFVPGMTDKVFLYGNGATTKDISGRFQYYN